MNLKILNFSESVVVSNYFIGAFLFYWIIIILLNNAEVNWICDCVVDATVLVNLESQWELTWLNKAILF